MEVYKKYGYSLGLTIVLWLCLGLAQAVVEEVDCFTVDQNGKQNEDLVVRWRLGMQSGSEPGISYVTITDVKTQVIKTLQPSKIVIQQLKGGTIYATIGMSSAVSGWNLFYDSKKDMTWKFKQGQEAEKSLSCSRRNILSWPSAGTIEKDLLNFSSNIDNIDVCDAASCRNFRLGTLRNVVTRKCYISDKNKKFVDEKGKPTNKPIYRFMWDLGENSAVTIKNLPGKITDLDTTPVNGQTNINFKQNGCVSGTNITNGWNVTRNDPNDELWTLSIKWDKYFRTFNLPFRTGRTQIYTLFCEKTEISPRGVVYTTATSIGAKPDNGLCADDNFDWGSMQPDNNL
jgi:hypothetical protein